MRDTADVVRDAAEALEGQHPPLACRPSPPQGTRKGGDRQLRVLCLFFDVRDWRNGGNSQSPPLAGEMSGRTEGVGRNSARRA
ncbi:conserved hypothetical protein [Mesorhizobium delmotii]|uniref:Uncharacterized protein n=1 Tax=Mesorhizobium delmotii TaxID=1631247 RepID=A0A2P9AJW9_9HYPH|nr:conserved hypothetical protein [Mesorhizobium delmotii]